MKPQLTERSERKLLAECDPNTQQRSDGYAESETESR